MKKLLATTALSLIPFGAVAADLPRRAAAPTPVFVAAPFSWSGFYVGLNAGYASLDARSQEFDAGTGCYNPCSEYNNVNARGILAGGQVGYNFQSGSIVYGVEADLGFAAAKRTGVPNTSGGDPEEELKASLKAFGSVRARLGFAHDRTLFFVTGGLAVARVQNQFTDYDGGFYPDIDVRWTSTKWRTGWVAGGGIEHALSNNISVKLEALYYNLGSQNVIGRDCCDNYGMRFRNDGVIARAGLNFRF